VNTWYISDDDLKNYHIGLSFEDACRSYVGMIETGEVNIDQVRKHAPRDCVKVVNDYFAEDTDINSFMFPQIGRHAEIRQIAQRFGASNGWTGTSGMLSSIIVELLDEMESQYATNA